MDNASKCCCGCGCRQANYDPFGSYCSDCACGDCPGPCRVCRAVATLHDSGRCNRCERGAEAARATAVVQAAEAVAAGRVSGYLVYRAATDGMDVGDYLAHHATRLEMTVPQYLACCG